MKKKLAKSKKRVIKAKENVSVAQSDRVSASDAEGCEFEPRRIRHKKNHRGVVFFVLQRREARTEKLTFKKVSGGKFFDVRRGFVWRFDKR